MILVTTDVLLEEISDSLTKSMPAIIIAFAALFMFIIIMIYINIKSRKKEKIEINKHLLERYNELIKKFQLSDDEKKVIDSLAVYLKNSEKKYLLLINFNTFRGALSKFRKNNFVKDSIVKSLELKLGFNNISKYSELKTSYDLPDNMHVMVIVDKNIKIPGKIIKAEDSVRIAVNYNGKIKSGKKSVILTHNYSGIYAFNSELIKFEHNIMYFFHSLEMKKFQRREYFRKKINIDVFINKTGFDNKKYKVFMYDISAGGASLKNPEKLFKEHDDIKISFPDIEHSVLRLNAEILRISIDKKVMYVKFSHLKPEHQDDIINLVNK